MAKSVLGGGDEYGMQLLAGYGANEDGGSTAASGSRGLATLAVAAVARVATAIIRTGSALTPGDISGIGGDRGEGTGGGAA